MKTIILQTQDALLAGERDRKLVDVYSDTVLWQCTTCGACENQCPVGIEHLPILVGALGRLMLEVAGTYGDGTIATSSDEGAIERVIGPGVRGAAARDM